EATRNEPTFPSISNTQSWNQYGNAIGGAISPCSTTLPALNGFICPLSDPATSEYPLVFDNEGGPSTVSLFYGVNNGGYIFPNIPLASYPTGISFITRTDAD